MASRFYLPSEEWETGVLSGEEARHAIKVLRVRIGEQIEVFDGKGRVAKAVVKGVSGKNLEFELGLEERVKPLNPIIKLYQAVPKGKSMELIIQKAVELGVTEIQPLITDNTVAVSDAPTKKAEKWQRVALEAAKQCKQAWLPKVHEPLRFGEVNWQCDGLKLVASLRDNARLMREVLGEQEASSTQHISLLVGPEGDLSGQEYNAAEEAGFLPVSMGELVLRVETASLYGLSALSFYYLKDASANPR